VRKGTVLVVGLTIVAGLLILAGCGGKKSDFHVKLSDAGGLEEDSPVRWRGLEVGKVTSVQMADGAVRADVVLSKEYRGKLREGLKARVSKGFLGKGTPTLQLYGGGNPELPPLTRGTEIPEAGALAGFSKTHAIVVGVVFVALLLFCLVLKGIKKLVAFAVALAFLAFSGWFLKLQFDRHRSELLSPELEAKITEQAEQILGSPEAQAAWQTIQADIANALEELKKQTGAAKEAGAKRIQEKLRQKVEELKGKGATAAADDLLKLKEQVEKVLAGDRPE